MKIAPFQKNNSDSTSFDQNHAGKKKLFLPLVLLIIIIIALGVGIAILSQKLQTDKVTQKSKAAEPKKCNITLTSKYLTNGQFWFSVAPQNGPINLHSNAFICGSTKNSDGNVHCDGQVESFIRALRPINYEADPTPLTTKKEFAIDVPCNGVIQIDFWDTKGTTGNYEYQPCIEHLYEAAPQCALPTEGPITPTATITPQPSGSPTISPTTSPTTLPNSTITPNPPTTTSVPPTSPPSSTTTPQPTSTACVQAIPNVLQGVGIETINNNQCKLSWNEVSNVTGYQVSWGENPNAEGKPNVNLGKVLTYTFDCPDLTTKTYYFKVRGINECAEGTFSNIVHAGSWPTPTEIILANTTSTIGPTKQTTTPSIPSAGVAQFGFLLIPLGIIMMALIL